MTASYHNPPPSCLLCFNVRTGALLKAFIVMFSGFFIMAFTVLNKVGYLSDLPSESDYTKKVLQYYAHSDKAFYLTLLNGLFYLMIGSFGVVGIVKNRAKYLLPLLVVQIFDVISVMGVLCSVLFLTNRYDSFVEQLGNVVSEDFKEWILSLDPDWRFVTIVTYFAGMLFISILFAKAIYLTYKHITLEDIAQHRRVREVSVVGLPDDEEHRIEGPIYKLPRYEDLQKTPLVENEEDYPTKPPAYEA